MTVTPEQPSRRSGPAWPPAAAVAHRRATLPTAILAAIYGALAIAALSIGSLLGNVHSSQIEPRVVIWVSAAMFVIFGVATTRQLSRWLERAISTRTRTEAGTAFRVVVAIVGYVVVLFATLGLISVPLGRLAVGGAIAGVVVGIAAQQALGNVFAGIVLLLARPFRLGDHVRIRSGALGGEFDGIVRAMNLTYVMVRTEQGLLNVPNSAMLAAAVGPWKKASVSTPPAAPAATAAPPPAPTSSTSTDGQT